jgi:hypothetical protein
MFGYVVPQKSELRIREYEVFKSYYCSLCTEIGKKSQISRLALTFDMTFLVILLSSMNLDKEIGYKKLCPFKMSRVKVFSPNIYLEYAADMNIILSNRKLIDNYKDDKSIFSLIASKFVNTKTLSFFGIDKIEVIDNNLRVLSKLEKDKCNNLDEVGHCFGNLTSEIFNIGGSTNSRVLSILGYNIGKWIYTIDAYDDLEKDIRMNKYNPFIFTFEYNGGDIIEFKNSIKDNAKFTLIKCLDEISKAYELLNIKKNNSLIENIIYIGMKQKTESILEGRCCNDKSIRNLRGKGECN